jgi:hypothetical protein
MGKAMSQKTPEPVKDFVRTRFGLGSILAQSGVVANAFGPERGFWLIVMTIVASVLLTASTLFLISRGVVQFIG